MFQQAMELELFIIDPSTVGIATVEFRFEIKN